MTEKQKEKVKECPMCRTFEAGGNICPSCQVTMARKLAIAYVYAKTGILCSMEDFEHA